MCLWKPWVLPSQHAGMRQRLVFITLKLDRTVWFMSNFPKILASLGINTFCTQQSQCSPYGAAFCPTISPKKCACHDYASYNPATELCEFKTGLGKFCQVDQDCKQLNNTACSSKNTCQCKPNFVAQNEECKPSAFANFLPKIFTFTNELLFLIF